MDCCKPPMKWGLRSCGCCMNGKGFFRPAQLETGWKSCHRFDQNALVYFRALLNHQVGRTQKPNSPGDYVDLLEKNGIQLSKLLSWSTAHVRLRSRSVCCQTTRQWTLKPDSPLGLPRNPALSINHSIPIVCQQAVGILNYIRTPHHLITCYTIHTI